MGALINPYVYGDGGAGSNYDSAVLALTPSAYFKFSEATTGEWTDATGNGNTATPITGATAHDTGGPLLTGLTSGRVALAAGEVSTSLDPASSLNVYSVACWVKTSAAAWQYLFGSRGSGIPGLGCYVGGAPVAGGPAGTVNWGVSHDSVWRGRKTSEVINGNTWRHLVAVFNRPANGTILTTDFLIYLDGVLGTLSNTDYSSMNAPINMSNWHLGDNAADGGAGFSGDFSRVAFFPQALTAQNVADLYAAA